ARGTEGTSSDRHLIVIVNTKSCAGTATRLITDASRQRNGAARRTGQAGASTTLVHIFSDSRGNAIAAVWRTWIRRTTCCGCSKRENASGSIYGSGDDLGDRRVDVGSGGLQVHELRESADLGGAGGRATRIDQARLRNRISDTGGVAVRQNVIVAENVERAVAL